MFVLWFLNITMSICLNISGKLTTKSYTEKWRRKRKHAKNTTKRGNVGSQLDTSRKR
jgi:hypothetical protein